MATAFNAISSKIDFENFKSVLKANIFDGGAFIQKDEDATSQIARDVKQLKKKLNFDQSKFNSLPQNTSTPKTVIKIKQKKDDESSEPKSRILAPNFSSLPNTKPAKNVVRTLVTSTNRVPAKSPTAAKKLDEKS